MRVTLFWYMIVSVCLNFPILIGAPFSEWAMLPSAEALHLRRLRRNLFGVLSEQDLEGNRNPQGGAAEAEERAAAGRMKKPRSGARTEAGYITADTRQSKVVISPLLAAEGYRDYRSIRAGMSAAKGRCPPPPLHIGRLLFARSTRGARGQVGQASRIGSKSGHR